MLIHVASVVVPVHEAKTTQLAGVGWVVEVNLLDVTLQAVNGMVAVSAVLTSEDLPP